MAENVGRSHQRQVLSLGIACFPRQRSGPVTGGNRRRIDSGAATELFVVG